MQTPDAVEPLAFACRPDAGFTRWLADSGGSLAITTYQAGKLLLIGWNGRQVSALLRDFDKIMGLDTDGDRLLLATRYGVELYANAPALAPNYRERGRYDALYLPRVNWPMPDMNIHDVALTETDIWLVATRCNALVSPSDRHSFEPRWRPPFISDLVPEDRCHLNGLAMRKGRPGFVTALGETDELVGWRERKADGGIVIDVDSGEIVLRGLAMPHSPRWHDDKLYVLNSGAGELLCVDPETGRSETVCRLQGYLRGLTFVGDYAVIGLCQIRETHIFGGMPVQQAYDRLLCGVAIVALASGAQIGCLEITSGCSEIFDLRFLEGSRKPNILSGDKTDIHDALTAPGCHFWLREANAVEDRG